MTSVKDQVFDKTAPEFTTQNLDPTTLTSSEKTAQAFTSLFPYAWKFIYAKNIDRTTKPEWKTETRYPITGRRLYDQWADPNTLIGVRFGNQTSYAMIDIDQNSPYHPSNNHEKYKTVLQALEEIGLVRPLIIQSSHSQGLHIYYPLNQEVPSFGIACAIRASLQKHNCEIAAGIIETFPNTKKYESEYNGHRLPLQTGSYQLDKDLQIIGQDLNQFITTWQTIQEHQDLELLNQAIAEAKANYQPPKDNRKTIQWRDDLEQQIQQGWTGQGQSNQLLYLMGKYARIFLGCEENEAIAEYIIKTAKSATGFTKFCQDINRLEQKAKDISKWCIKHHFPWGSKKREKDDQNKSTNPEDTATQKAQKQAERLERIRTSVNELNKTGGMPKTIRGMAQAIAKSAKVSVETLYENRELWHPEFIESCNSTNPNNSAPSFTEKAQPTKQAKSQTEQAVTEKPLYKALALSETPLRGQELPKFADVDLQSSKDFPELPLKSSTPMWIEKYGRLSQPKAEISKNAVSQNSFPKTENGDCLQSYETSKSEPVSVIGSRIGYLRTLLETPILRRGKSDFEIARLQDELERLERDRQSNSSS